MGISSCAATLLFVLLDNRQSIPGLAPRMFGNLAVAAAQIHIEEIFSPLQLLLRPAIIDLLEEFCGLYQNCGLVVGDFHKATAGGHENFPIVRSPEPDLSHQECGNYRRVIREDTEITLSSRDYQGGDAIFE